MSLFLASHQCLLQVLWRFVKPISQSQAKLLFLLLTQITSFFQSWLVEVVGT